MKKLFVAVLAIAGLVACNNEETVLVKGNAPIAFDSFVENATRANDPSTTTASLDAFDVWAYMDELAGTVFVGEDVTKRNGEWSYQNTQYWVPGHDYYFTAIAPMNSENWSYNQVEKTIEFTNVDGSEDLLFERVVATNVVADQSAVNLEFKHLLSKVKFTFVNGFLTDNAFVKVEAVKMVAPNTGVYDIASESWTVAGSETYEFGDVAKLGMAEKAAAAEERLTIPAAADYTVTFKATLYMGEVEAMSQEFEVAVKNVLLEKGKAYNFVAEVNPDSFKLKAIEFNVVTVNEWVTAEDDANVEEAELLAAAQLGGEVVLTRDLELSKPVAVKGNLVVNLNGKTISIDREGVETQDYVFAVFEGGKLTINGEGTVEAVTGNDGYAVIASGEVVINGGTFKAGVDENGEANAVVYARGNGKVYVDGGNFPNEANSTYVLNKKDADRATTVIEVRGGSFFNFNPADNAAENPGTNFCAEGYGVIKNGDYYNVLFTAGVAKVDAVVNNVNDLNTAMANGGAIVLQAGEYGTIVAKSNVTLIGTEGAEVDCVNLCGADNITLKNIAFDAATAKRGYDNSGAAKLYANIITGDNTNKMNKGSHNVVIDGCTFTGTFANGGAAIAFTDYKRTSGFSGNITIKNCTFEQDGAYYNIYGHYTGDSLNGHGNFVIENNTFNTVFTQGGAIYLGRYASNVPVEVKGNTFNVATSLNDAMFVQDHSNYGVSINASNNTFAN